MKETKKAKFDATGNTLGQIPTDLLVNNCICLSYYKNAYINRKTQQKKISTMADILPILNINCSEVIIRSDIYYSCKTYNVLAIQPQVATVWSSQNVRTTKFNPLITRKKVFFPMVYCFAFEPGVLLVSLGTRALLHILRYHDSAPHLWVL